MYVFTPQLLLGGGLAGAACHFLPAVRREELRVQAVSREGLRELVLLAMEPVAWGGAAGVCLGGMMADV